MIHGFCRKLFDKLRENHSAQCKANTDYMTSNCKIVWTIIIMIAEPAFLKQLQCNHNKNRFKVYNKIMDKASKPL